MNQLEKTLSKKSVTINVSKLDKVKKILKKKTHSETIRYLIDKELEMQVAFRANQRLRLNGEINLVEWR